MITDYLPAPARKLIYSLFATFMAIEGVLDVAEYGPTGKGFLDEKAQGVVLGIAAVLGFGLALSKTTDIKTTTLTVEENPGDAGHGTLEIILLAAAVAVIVFAILVAVSDSITF